MWWLGALLLGSVEPCYGFEGQGQIEGEHVWVDYDSGVSESQAMAVLVASDTAWNIYADELGWPSPPEPIAMRADLDGDMASGQCITVECGDEFVPLCHVFAPAFQLGVSETTAAHEVGHAFQYAWMGNYVDSLASWAWWMEGSATWISWFYEDHADIWHSAGGYVGNPGWALHNDFSEIFSGTRGRHMYGTAVIAFFLAQYYGGPETVRATWEWGAQRTGERIFFPDAIDGIGLSFDEVWPHWLAVLTVLDFDGGQNIEQIPAHTVISALPGSGAPPPASRPEGLGVGIVRVPADLGAPGMDLRVQVDGDPSVPWHAALARTDGTTPGSRVIDYVAGTFDDAGHAELVLAGFDGSAEAFLAVSPESIERTQFDYTVSAELVPMEVGGSSSSGGSDETTAASTSTGVAGEDSGDTDPAEVPSAGSEGCGCRTSGDRTLPLFLLVVLALRRRCGKMKG